MRFLIPLTFACCFAGSAFATDMPVTEIKLDQDAHQHAQLKTDFAFKEVKQAESNFEAAERDAAEADRVHQQAQRQADEAKQRLLVARQKVENAKTALLNVQKKLEAESQELNRESGAAANAKQKT
jgi:hypothetical protein